jgi:hypothetical protein
MYCAHTVHLCVVYGAQNNSCYLPMQH